MNIANIHTFLFYVCAREYFKRTMALAVEHHDESVPLPDSLHEHFGGASVRLPTHASEAFKKIRADLLGAIHLAPPRECKLAVFKNTGEYMLVKFFPETNRFRVIEDYDSLLDADELTELESTTRDLLGTIECASAHKTVLAIPNMQLRHTLENEGFRPLTQAVQAAALAQHFENEEVLMGAFGRKHPASMVLVFENQDSFLRFELSNHECVVSRVRAGISQVVSTGDEDVRDCFLKALGQRPPRKRGRETNENENENENENDENQSPEHCLTVEIRHTNFCETLVTIGAPPPEGEQDKRETAYVCPIVIANINRVVSFPGFQDANIYFQASLLDENAQQVSEERCILRSVLSRGNKNGGEGLGVFERGAMSLGKFGLLKDVFNHLAKRDQFEEFKAIPSIGWIVHRDERIFVLTNVAIDPTASQRVTTLEARKLTFELYNNSMGHVTGITQADLPTMSAPIASCADTDALKTTLEMLWVNLRSYFNTNFSQVLSFLAHAVLSIFIEDFRRMAAVFPVHILTGRVERSSNLGKTTSIDMVMAIFGQRRPWVNNASEPYLRRFLPIFNGCCIALDDISMTGLNGEKLSETIKGWSDATRVCRHFASANIHNGADEGNLAPTQATSIVLSSNVHPKANSGNALAVNSRIFFNAFEFYKSCECADLINNVITKEWISQASCLLPMFVCMNGGRLDANAAQRCIKFLGSVYASDSHNRFHLEDRFPKVTGGILYMCLVLWHILGRDEASLDEILDHFTRVYPREYVDRCNECEPGFRFLVELQHSIEHTAPRRNSGRDEASKTIGPHNYQLAMRLNLNTVMTMCSVDEREELSCIAPLYDFTNAHPEDFVASFKVVARTPPTIECEVTDAHTQVHIQTITIEEDEMTVPLFDLFRTVKTHVVCVDLVVRVINSVKRLTFEAREIEQFLQRNTGNEPQEAIFADAQTLENDKVRKAMDIPDAMFDPGYHRSKFTPSADIVRDFRETCLHEGTASDELFLAAASLPVVIERARECTPAYVTRVVGAFKELSIVRPGPSPESDL
jgi:hypothetical protein